MAAKKERASWALDWTDADMPTSVGVYNEKNLALLFGLEEQGDANRDKEFDKVYGQVLKLQPAELAEYWKARSERHALLHRTNPNGITQPGGATMLMILIYEGRLDAAKAVASSSPPQHLTYCQSERFGPPRGALAALAMSTWPRLASAEETDAREALRLEILELLQQAARDNLQPPAAAADALVVACANGTLPETFLDALLRAVQFDEDNLRAAVWQTATAGNARALTWLLSRASAAASPASNGSPARGLSAASRLGVSAELMHAIELALASSASPAGPGGDHGLWMREMLRHIGRGHAATAGRAPLDVLTLPCRMDAPLPVPWWLPCGALWRPPPESVLQALVRLQPLTTRWLLDGGTPEPDVDTSSNLDGQISASRLSPPASPTSRQPPGDTMEAAVAPPPQPLLPAMGVIAYLTRPKSGGRLDRAWLSHLGCASGGGLLAGGDAGPLGAPLLACTLNECWQTYGASRVLYGRGALDVLCAIALTAHLSLAHSRANTLADSTADGTADSTADGARHAMRVVMEATLLAVPIALLSAWHLFEAMRHAIDDPAIGIRLVRASRVRAGQLLTSTVTLIALGVEAAAGAHDAAPLLGIAAALCWLRTLFLASASERGSTVLALLILSAIHLPLALAIACPIALAVSLVSDAIVGAAPGFVSTLLPAAGLGSGLAAALSVALTASDDTVLLMGARMVRLRVLAFLDATISTDALDEARARVLAKVGGEQGASSTVSVTEGGAAVKAAGHSAVELL